jgi:hypothetical protein
MLTRVLKLAPAAALALLLFAPEAGAWGVAHVGVARPLPARVVPGRTVGWGPGGVWTAGRPAGFGRGGRVYRSGYFGVGPTRGPVFHTGWVGRPSGGWGGFAYIW